MAYVGTPIDVGNQFSSLVGKRFSGDASTTAFTLDVRANSALDIEVFVENVRQDPNSAYTVDGTTLTFTAAPPSGTNNVYVVHQAPTVASVSPTAGSVTASSFDNSVISGHTALAATPADTDEFLISDAGTIKRIDFSLLGNAPAFSAQQAGNQSISNDSNVKVVFDTENWDSDSAFDLSNNKFVVPAGKAGKYYLQAHIQIPGIDANEFGKIMIYVNGSLVDFSSVREQKASSDRIFQMITAITYSLSASDYVEVYVYQNSGDAQNATMAYFTGHRLIGV